jgi:hypothetical protein
MGEPSVEVTNLLREFVSNWQCEDKTQLAAQDKISEGQGVPNKEAPHFEFCVERLYCCRERLDRVVVLFFIFWDSVRGLTLDFLSKEAQLDVVVLQP